VFSIENLSQSEKIKMFQTIHRREPNLAQNLFWFNPLFSNKTGKVVMDKLLANLVG
jgi:hypothetical protein